MRVLISTDTVGGVWTFTRELAEGLLERGCEVALVSLGRLPSPEQLDWVARVGLPYRALDVSLEWMEANERSYREAAGPVQQFAEEFRPDVLQLNQFCLGALPVQVPKVVTAHSDVLSWADTCRPEGLAESPWLRQYRALVRDGLRGADAVLAPTRWMLAALKRNFPVNAFEAVVPNGRRVPAGERAGKRRLQAVTAGRLWDEAKGIALLGEVHAAMPLLVAGECGFEGAEAAALPSVTLLGTCAEGDLLRLFRESAVYVCTSRYEPFGLAALEAGLCGCAVAARNIPALREVWEDGARFFRDAGELEALLNEWTADEERLRADAERTARRAGEYSRERMVDRYLEVFRQLLGDRVRSHAA